MFWGHAVCVASDFLLDGGSGGEIRCWDLRELIPAAAWQLPDTGQDIGLSPNRAKFEFI